MRGRGRRWHSTKVQYLNRNTHMNLLQKSILGPRNPADQVLHIQLVRPRPRLLQSPPPLHLHLVFLVHLDRNLNQLVHNM